MFRPKNEEAALNLRKLHTNEIRNLAANCEIIKWEMRWMVHVADLGDIRNPHKVLVGKTEEIIWKT